MSQLLLSLVFFTESDKPTPIISFSAQSRAEQSKTEQNRAKQSKTEQNRVGRSLLLLLQLLCLFLDPPSLPTFVFISFIHSLIFYTLFFGLLSLSFAPTAISISSSSSYSQLSIYLFITFYLFKGSSEQSPSLPLIRNKGNF